MQVWFLVLYMSGGNGQVIIPYHYESKEICEDAGSDWDEQYGKFSKCVKAYKEENTQ